MGCGAALARSCSACGRELLPDARFCDGCGAPLASAAPGSEDPMGSRDRSPAAYTPRHLAERILTLRGALEGERKHVTVLFADLKDSVALAEGVDPEEVHRLMDRAFQAMLAEVHRFEGTVNQFTGDGIMALFGAPVALEDAPVHAVRAALGIQRALEPVHRESRAAGRGDFRMRIGIHTGRVVVGKIGDDLRMDYTAIGDTTNLAARLQSIASPGSIVISEATRRLCSGFFELRALGKTRIKGRHKPVEAFEVLGERSVSGRIDALASTGLTPLVGRVRELGDLQAVFAEAVAGRGQVVFLVGEAGIGKSRLTFEFRNRLQGVPHLWIEGRCSTYTQTTAFHPIADALRRACGIDNRDTDASALAKLDRVIENLGEDARRTAPYLRRLLSLPVGDAAVESMDPITRRSETVKALQSLLVHATERQPVVLVIEDLHWIDRASEDFLGLLSDTIPAISALLVFTHRPGYVHPFGDRSFHTRIRLRTLSEPEMAGMASAILEDADLPATLRRRIAEKAEGNPLFIEEVTKSLLEEGVLVREGGRVRLRRGLEAIAIPDRIQDVLMARIDRLAQEPKRAIQLASVIRREFALRLLERISESSEPVSEVVDNLRVLELVYEKASSPELAFMFKHALTRDVAYESVLVQTRREMHRNVAAAIEELYPERLAEHYEALADHYSRGEDWARAFHYHELAAGKAAEAYANLSAVEHCRKALDLAPKLLGEIAPDRLAALEVRLGIAEQTLSNFAASGDAFLRAAELVSDGSGRALNLAYASWALLWAHDYDASRRAASEARELARIHAVPTAEVLALVTQAEHVIVEEGNLAETLSVDALRIAEESGDPVALIHGLTERGQTYEMQGDYRRAIEHCERAIQLATHERMESLAIVPRWMLGIALTCLGRYDQALGSLREAIALCDRIGDRALKARNLNTLGWCYAELGCHADAEPYNLEGTRIAAEMIELGYVPGAPELHANAAINLAGDRIALGQLDDALEVLEPIREHLERQGDPWMRWRYSLHFKHALARWNLARREPEAALALVEEEIVGALHHGARKIEARGLEFKVRVLLHLEKHAEARELLTEVLRVGREIEYPPVVWRGLSLQGELARRAGDREAADRAWQQSRSLVERLAAELEDDTIRVRFGALGETLALDPLGAYR